MKKTAFVYDKWLSSLGGGEVVACNFAITLRDQAYDTTFIAGQLIDPETIKQKLGIDMHGIRFIQAFNDEEKIKKITSNADIFINASFWDYTLSSAKKQFYYTSFPGKVSKKSIKAKIRSLLINKIAKIIKPIEKINSNDHVFYSLQPNNNYHLKFSVLLNNFSKSNLEKIDYSIENAKIIKQNIKINHFKNLVSFDLLVKSNSNSIILGLKLDLPPEEYSVHIDNFLSSLKFKKIDSTIRAGDYPNLYQRIHTFDQIFANSQYTKKWIKKYWNAPVQVLYPPVNLIKYNKSVKKKNYICSVGRFFTLGHGKKQEIMIEAFKILYDQGLKGWQLHLAGGLGSEPSSLAYAEHLKKISDGYPIFLHFNQSRQFIEELYLKSKIYWHAAGFGENPNKDPIKFEHFGITPIEAISSSCVPVLFNGGGLSEVVKLLGLDSKLHLFDTIDQLAINTKKIIDQNTKLPVNIYKQLESLFGIERFKKQFKEVISSNL